MTYQPHQSEDLAMKPVAGDTLDSPRARAMAKAAALAAATWWADRLDEQHAAKRDAFIAALAKHVEDGLNGVSAWSWNEPRKAGDGVPREWLMLECDYDPRGALLDAVNETIDPRCSGFLYSARGILPMKHELKVSRTVLCPKEGYGNWTPEISLPEVA